LTRDHGDAYNPDAVPHTKTHVQRSVFVGIDSDGCAFDTMEIKHRRCFAPEFVRWFGFEECAEPAEETWNFVNLYSASRGVNRYSALAQTLRLLPTHPAMAGDQGIPDMQGFHRWVDSTDAPSADSLTREIERLSPSSQDRHDLELVRGWSEAVDRSFDAIAAEVPPFAGVEEALRDLHGRSEVAVISHAPTSILIRQWALYGLDRWVGAIHGQESGKKSHQLSAAHDAHGFAPNRMLMIGDAPGDLAAARAVEAWFFPVVPGEEPTSWEQFRLEAWPRFLQGSWNIDYQRGLLAEFHDRLPSAPSWEQ
jgi:phosphoglycolate phosphatase-like HAD superfamily hydrolase